MEQFSDGLMLMSLYAGGSHRVLQAGLRTVQKSWVLYLWNIHMMEHRLYLDLRQIPVMVEMDKSGF